MNIYFDNAATTKVCGQAIDIMKDIMENVYGNPSSLHSMGMESENIIRTARGNIAKAMGVPDECIYFTSGGTESDNTAIFGGVLRNARGRKTVIASAAEHPAVIMPFKKLEEMGYNVHYINVKENGIIDLEHLEDLLNDDTVLVSIMQVNNETGCIMPLVQAVEIIRKKSPKALIHSDMVQSFGKADMGDVDLASISSHKIHGPKGIGGLYIKKGVHINPLIYGGGQEKDIRPGTQNVPGIAGFGAAASLINKEENRKYISKLKNRMIDLLNENIDNFRINGENTVPNILNISFEGAKSEVLLHMLESKGIMVSSGSACSSNKPMPSPVLTAMGVKKEHISAAIRFSFSRYNTEEEISYCVDVLKKELPLLRRMMR